MSSLLQVKTKMGKSGGSCVFVSCRVADEMVYT
jgi:hypothetical protein